MGVELNASINTNDFRMLNRCLDDAIASAVTEYGRQPDALAERARQPEANAAAVTGHPRQPDRSGQAEHSGGDEHLGVLGRELRTSIHTAMVALQVIKSGSVGIGGSTGTLLDRSLVGAEDLVERLLVEVYAARRSPGTIM